MRKVLNILVCLLTGAAIVLMLFSSGTDVPTARLLGGAFLLLAVLCAFLKDRMERQDNKKKPITSVEATVVSHHKVRQRVGRNYYVIRCYITFKTADGQVVEFEVSEIDYDDFDIGETDLLRYRGWEFLSFGVKDKSHIKPMAPLPEEYDCIEEEESLREKAAGFLSKMTERMRQEKPEAAAEKADGIMTHDLDE